MSGDPGPNQPWRIIVADDNPDDRSEVRRALLTGSGRRYAFVEVETGADAVRAVLADDGPPQCLVLDYHLPDMSAAEVLAAIRNPDGLPICPVVVSTGSAGSDVGRTVIRAGANDFIGKGWMTPESLTRAVENAGERWTMQRELSASEHRFRTAFDQQFQYALLLSPDGVVRDASRASLSGTPRDEVVGSSVWETPWWRELPAEGERLRTAIAEAGRGSTSQFESIFDSSLGGRRVADVAVKPLYDGDGRVWAVLAEGRDVTDQRAAEAAAREADDRLRLALGASGTGLWTWDLTTDAVTWSAECYPIHGLEPGTFGGTGAAFFRLVHPDDRERVEARVREAIARRERYECEFRIIRPSGEAVWVGNVGRARYAEDGHPVSVLGTITDVNARRIAEQRLRESDERFRLFVERVRDYAIFALDRDGRVSTWNAGAERIKGYSAEEAVGLPLEMLYSPEDRAAGVPRAMLAAAAAEGTINGRGERVRKDGSRFVAEVELTALHDQKGELRGFVNVTRDVTARKQAEDELARSERFARSVVEASADCVKGISPDGRLLWMNENGRQLMEVCDFSSLKGSYWAAFWEQGGVKQEAEAALAAALAGGIGRFRGFCPTILGSPRWWDVMVTPITGPNGQIEQILSVSRDVTEQRSAEEALRIADRRKDEFLATLAHELRNPLAPLKNGVQVLRMSTDGAQTSRARDMMDRQLAHLVHLVDDLLDVSRVSQGKITLRREPVALSEAVAAAVEACRPLIDEKRHALTLDVPEPSPVVDGDRTRLVQVVSNFLTNAAKYTDPGGRIGVRVSAENGSARVTVTDDGLGLQADALGAVWELFTQVRSTADRSQGGLGIGLSLVRRLAELHGGRVGVESPGPGRGSTFWVELPIAAAPYAQRASAPPLDTTIGGLRVLVVDDNADGADSLTLLLELSGYIVRTAYSGREAEEAAADFHPQVIFLDIGLPDMTGYELAARLRRAEGGGALTLVALTGWGSDDDRTKAADAGFDHHLTKPADAAAVLGFLAAVGSRRPSSAENASTMASR